MKGTLSIALAARSSGSSMCQARFRPTSSTVAYSPTSD